jgi:hypothetical protein
LTLVAGRLSLSSCFLERNPPGGGLLGADRQRSPSRFLGWLRGVRSEDFKQRFFKECFGFIRGMLGANAT